MNQKSIIRNLRQKVLELKSETRNLTRDARTEDFDSLAKCVKWLQGKDLEEIEKVEEGIRHISDTCIKPDLKCDYCKDGKCKDIEHGLCIFRKIEGWRVKEA